MQKWRVILVVLLLWGSSAGANEAQRLEVGRFSAADLSGWQEKSFAGHSSYTFVTLEGRTTALQAESRQSASGLVKKIRVDLQKFPFLNWRWRTDRTLPPADETTKRGDDYVARMYVVIDGGLFFWQTKAVNYVWAAGAPEGTTWPNAFAGASAMMLALRSATAARGVWYTEKRNVAADLKMFFGAEIRYIDAVALMTDTDNSGGAALAYYGDIYFSAR